MYKRIFSLIPIPPLLLALIVLTLSPVICTGVPFCIDEARAERKGFSFIRDTEIEHTIRSYATPLFDAAGLNAQSIRVHLVNDSRLNAFVAGGMNLFINTGLLTRSKDANEIIGVIAHETGHISGGHLVRSHDAMRNASAQAILAYVLGTVAIVSGQGELGSAIILGGKDAELRSYLSYSRAQESAADQAAITLLDATKQSGQGLHDFMKILEGQELLTARRQDPYLRSHPITRDRVTFLKEHLRASDYTDTPTDQDFARKHRFMVAKLFAFLQRPATTLRRYKKDDTAPASRYARSIAFFRDADIDLALPLIDGLITESPNNPFFYELKGQMLFESGRLEAALPAYQRAADILPKAQLILIDLARTQIELGSDDLVRKATKNLTVALGIEPNSPFGWRQLAIAHGKIGDLGLSYTALAEEAYLLGNHGDARYHIARGERVVKKGSSQWLRLQDIKTQLQNTAGSERK